MIQQATSAKHSCCSNAPSARFRGLPGCAAGRAGSARRWSLAHSPLGRSAGLDIVYLQLVLWRAGPVAAGPVIDSQVDSRVAPCDTPKGAPAAHLALGLVLRSWPAMPESLMRLSGRPDRGGSLVTQQVHRTSHQSAPTSCAAVSWQAGDDALHWCYLRGTSPSEGRWR
eukprot:scaffold102406_cov63-Phaeocystis_antarctica.AAC.5